MKNHQKACFPGSSKITDARLRGLLASLIESAKDLRAEWENAYIVSHLA